MTEEQNQEEVGIDEEYEEICGEEVDRVVEALEQLITTVNSENIKSYLDEALNEIYYLIHEEGEEDEEYEDEEFEDDDTDLTGTAEAA